MSMLYILTGPAGVGKSTISRQVASKIEKSALIEGDSIYSQVIGRICFCLERRKSFRIIQKNMCK